MTLESPNDMLPRVDYSVRISFPFAFFRGGTLVAQLPCTDRERPLEVRIRVRCELPHDAGVRFYAFVKRPRTPVITPRGADVPTEPTSSTHSLVNSAISSSPYPYSQRCGSIEVNAETSMSLWKR